MKTYDGFRRHALPVLLTFAMMLAVAACKSGSSQEPAAASSTSAVSNPLEIKAKSELLQQLKIGDVIWADVSASQMVPARVEVDDTRITRVGSPVMGRISSLSVREGQEVHRGEVLALLNSTGLSDAQLGFLKAVSQRLVASRSVERAQLLLKADVIGSAELQRREAELSQASAELDAARDQLELLGMPASDIAELEKTRAIKSVSRVVAGMDGTVLSRKITLGQVIQPADTIFEISDLSSVWLVADVPEQTAGKLHAGQAAEATIAALPDLKIRGRLSFVSATVNPETRTIRARMDLVNRSRTLKPAMLATMTLKDETARQRLVPASAVVREDDKEHIFVQLSADTFVLREVKLGGDFDGRRVLVEGIQPDEKIVLDGAFHLNNERRRQLLRATEGG
jgi:cobalt-zinc-cadmium efflux system membrane fusion protein